MATLNLYDTDFYAWTQEQAKLIRQKAFDKLDIEHLFDEVESMGKREKRELASRLEILLMHLLKWSYQPEWQSKSWSRTIREQRHQIKMIIQDNPSLKPLVQDFIDSSYKYARDLAHMETGVFLENFPISCEWTIDQILEDSFFPG